MEENFDKENNNQELIQKAERMLNEKDAVFHDIEEFEEVAEFYLEDLQLEQTLAIVKKGLEQYPNSPNLLMICVNTNF